MVNALAHIGIAVKDLESSIRLFSSLLGRKPDHREEVPNQMVRTAMFHGGDTSIELLEATSADSAIARFIDKRGEGMHHISLTVDDIHAELKRLKAEGFDLIDGTPRPGAEGCLVAFLRPKSTNGVLIELSQKVA